jgi:hypothetical protein
MQTNLKDALKNADGIKSPLATWLVIHLILQNLLKKSMYIQKEQK